MAYALQFDGTNSIVIPDAADLDLNLTNGWTIWFRAKIADNTGTTTDTFLDIEDGSFGADYVVLTMGHASHGTSYKRNAFLATVKDHLTYSQSYESNAVTIPNADFVTYYVSVVSGTIYVGACTNGGMVSERSAASVIADNVLGKKWYIGARTDGTYPLRAGTQIESFGVSSGKMTNAEIEAVAAGTAFDATTATVVRYYEMNEGSGGVINDKTNTGNAAYQGAFTGLTWVDLGGGSDTTPDAFSFTDQTDVAVSTLTTSNTLTITGMDAGTAISVSGGEMSINSGAFTTSATTIDPSDTVALRVTSSASNSTASNVTLTIGTVSDIWTVTTVAGAGDTTPDAFSFTDQTDVAVSTLTTSNTITVTGIDAATAISVTGGEMSINSGAFTSSSSTVSVNDTVQLRVTSSASNSTAVNVTLDIGGVTDIWSVTTVAVATGTITTGAFENNTGTLQTGLSGLRVVVLDPTDGSTVLNSTGNTTHATTAVLTLSDAALTPATTYGVITLNTAGTAIGAELITAT